MPGTQLVNRLQDLHYRVHVPGSAEDLVAGAPNLRPMVIFMELGMQRDNICALIARLRRDPLTAHIPIVAFASEAALPIKTAAEEAGATAVVADAAVLAHLPQLLEQVLRVE